MPGPGLGSGETTGNVTRTYEGNRKTEGNGAQLHLNQQKSAGWGPGALGSLQLCHTRTVWRATSLDLCFSMWKWRTSASLPLTFWEAGQGGRALSPPSSWFCWTGPLARTERGAYFCQSCRDRLQGWAPSPSDLIAGAGAGGGGDRAGF